jgi:hypothetical protein
MEEEKREINYSNDKCWAKDLGNCSNKVTREHIVSNSILPDFITVSGFEWCKGTPKTVGRNSLVNKFLCGVHNEALSEYDKEATKFFETIKDVTRKWKLDERVFKEENINGLKFERWLLKTFINLVLTNDTSMSSINMRKILPVLYENATFNPPYGFGLASRVSQIINFSPRVELRALYLTLNGVQMLSGGLFITSGLCLTLFIPSFELTEQDIEANYNSDLSDLGIQKWSELQTDRHIKEIIFTDRVGNNLHKINLHYQN